MTVPRDVTMAKMAKLSEATLRHTPSQRYTAADRFEERAAERLDAPFILFEDRRISYVELNALANRIAHSLRAAGFRAGDVAALMMENRPEFIASWLGLAKLGVTAALINTNIRGKAFAQVFEAACTRRVIVGSECLDGLLTADPDLLESLHVYPLGDPLSSGSAPAPPPGSEDLDAVIASASSENPDPALRRDLVAGDPLFYIFTSGTAGLPKAALWSHMRFLGGADGVSAVVGYRSVDVLGCALPLYHGSGGASLVGCAISSGAAIALRRKFSASRFWDEARRYGTTAFQYVGEFCRYLLHQPPRADDRDHSIRIAFGAGLGADIWEEFRNRFGIEHIYEGWGATEANTNLLNLDNKVGSVGRIPYPERHNLRLVRYDLESDTYLRDDRGFCIVCEPGEVGEALGAIPDLPDSGAGRFEGYTSGEATAAKILENVFREGDKWWRSGDLFRRDEDDYYYFVDRVGDTFRWKSENVSTQEVAEVLGGFPGVQIANVYGVRVPKTEGRAGMAALTVASAEEFDGKAFFEFSRARLPSYAVPIFIRLSGEDVTTTFKLRKVDLQREGYDPSRIADPLFVLDEEEGTYLPLTEGNLEKLGYPPFGAE